VRYLAGDRGVGQFIDIGSGLPTMLNTHEVAQQAAPDARVVYVDNDPLVRVHGEALLATDGNTRVIQADLCAPDDVLGHLDLRALIDLSQPTVVLLVAVMHFIADASEPYDIVSRYLQAMAPGRPPRTSIRGTCRRWAARARS
jgi:hypothetical protein